MTTGAPTTADLLAWMGTNAPAQPDAGWSTRLSDALDAATQSVEGRCYAQYVDDTDPDFTEYPAGVRVSILMLAHLLYERGVPTSASVPLDVNDVNMRGLLGPYLDYTRVFA